MDELYITARDLREFGKENKNFWIIETKLVEDLGLETVQDIFVNEVVRKKKRLSVLDLYRQGKQFVFPMASHAKFHFAAKKGIIKAIEKAEEE